MGLSCGCNYDTDDFDSYWWPAEDFTTCDRKRRTKCHSCAAVIAPGDECVCIRRTRGPKNDIEERIYGCESDAIALGPWWFCRHCGEIMLNLEAYGYCVDYTESMDAQLREHWEMSGFDPQAAEGVGNERP